MMSKNRTRRWLGVPFALAALAAFTLGGVFAEEAPDEPAEEPVQEQELDLNGAIAGLPGVERFAAAFESFAVADLLQADATYTIFAPTDAALEAAGIEFMSADDVLAYIVEGTYLSADLVDLAQGDPEGAEGEPSTLTSLAGSEIVVGAGQPGDVVLDESAFVALPDHSVGNVTIHTIHDVLGAATTSE